MLARRVALALPFPLLLILACGSSGPAASGTGGAAGAGGSDGKYHPTPNGTAMSEADACNALSSAQDADTSALSCLSTSRACPDLLRAQFTTACLQYDQGTVQGCVAYYAAAKTCETLAAAIADCEVMPIAGSAPNGC